MVHYIVDDLIFIKSPRKDKKYRVFIGDNKYVDFGAIKNSVPMAQYRDDISNLYKKYSHYDKERRTRYYNRHKKDYEYPSADYFSKRYLWPLD
jgi:hypothetical protein